MNEHGLAVPLRSHDAFLGLLRYALGEDLRPFMRYAKDVAGSNCLRTFCLMSIVPAQNGLPPLVPDLALAHLSGYLELAASEGLYVDVTAGDAQILLQQVPAQRMFFRNVGEVMLEHPNAALLTPNEPWKNGLDPYMSLTAVPSGVLRARGASQAENAPYEPPLDCYNQHGSRVYGDDG